MKPIKPTGGQMRNRPSWGMHLGAAHFRGQGDHESSVLQLRPEIGQPGNLVSSAATSPRELIDGQNALPLVLLAGSALNSTDRNSQRSCAAIH